jgi:tRNA modification GTPase
MQTTIVAISTPPGNSGVGIVRISGTDALCIAKNLTGKKFAPRVVTTCKILNDTALAIYFKAPHSFTGEDIIEFQCHGGWLLLNKVVEAAIKHGATQATRGEFSRRAFLNGKLSLDQAETIIEIINAESDAHLKYATQGITKQLQSFEKSLIEIKAQIEASLDFPDDVQTTELEEQIGRLLINIQALNATSSQGRLIANGINVAVLGKPNVGKSSIFNALLNHDRSIVTEIAGTTTDTISDAIQYNGIKIIFHDTAGLHQASGKIEKLGIQRTKKTIEDCDIALVIFDITEPFDHEVLELVQNKPHIIVCNKCDLQKRDGVFMASAKTGEGIPQIKQKIYDLCIKTPQSASQIIVTNARHASELSCAQTAIEGAFVGLKFDVPMDAIASDIATALGHIGNITGTHASEAVLDEIFSRFCLGK